MSGWRIRPIYALLAAVTLGILAAPYLLLPPIVYPVLAVAALIAGLMLLRRSEKVAFALFVLTVGLIGMGRAREAATPGPADVSRFNDSPSLWVRGIVVSDVEVREGRFRGASGSVATCMIAVLSVYDFERVYPATGRARVTIASPAYGEQTANLPAPGAEVWLRGQLSTPLPAMNPGAFDYRTYLARRGVFSLMMVRRPGDLRPTGAATSAPLARTALAIRNAVRRATAANLRPDDAALLDGLLLSVRTQLPVEMQDAFARTGTVHILSVSGLHLSVLAAFLALLLPLLHVPRRIGNGVSIALLWLFVLAAGASEAAVRSAVMATLILSAPLVRRTSEPMHSLAAAGVGILLVTPGALYDAGFQLSFATTGAILLWVPPLVRLLTPREVGMSRSTLFVRRFVVLPLLTGLIAQAGSAPLVAYHFNRLSLVAPLANVPITALTDILLIGGLTAAGTTLLVGPLLTAPLWVALAFGLWLLRTLALWFAAWPLASLSVVSPPVVVLVVYYALLGGVAAYVRTVALRKRLFAPSLLPPLSDSPVGLAGSAAGESADGGLPRVAS